MAFTKRDFKFFALGFFAFFVLESALNYKQVINEIKKGYHDGYNNAIKENKLK
jgi:hypothetical protein